MIQFAVGYWGSHPDEENDDMWCGAEFDTLEAARAFFDAPVATGSYCPAHHIAFVTLDVISDTGNEYHGPDVSAIRPNPTFDARRRDRDVRAEMALDRAEAITQAGMMGGCDAANDEAEGWL